MLELLAAICVFEGGLRQYLECRDNLVGTNLCRQQLPRLWRADEHVVEAPQGRQMLRLGALLEAMLSEDSQPPSRVQGLEGSIRERTS